MREKLLNVVPECYVDTNLIELLLDASVNHQHCCSKVVGLLNSKLIDKFAIGIIDRDKVELGYIRDCNEVAKSEHLTLLKHKNRSQFLITIYPAVDGFVLDCARQQGVNPVDFGIPSDLKGFTKVSKAVTSNADTRFKSLFATLKNNPEIKTLKIVLNYLCQHQYASDLNQLKYFFD